MKSRRGLEEGTKETLHQKICSMTKKETFTVCTAADVMFVATWNISRVMRGGKIIRDLLLLLQTK